MTRSILAHQPGAVTPLRGKFSGIIYGSAEWADHYASQFKARRGIMLHAVNLGWSLKDCRVVFLNPANPGSILWTQGSDGRELRPSEKTGRLEGDFKSCTAKAVQSPPAANADEIRQRVGVIRGQVATAHFPGRTGRTDKDVLLAVLARMTEVGCDQVNLSVRDASLRAGVTRKTAGLSLARLVQDGWLERTRSIRPGLNTGPVAADSFRGGPQLLHMSPKDSSGEVIWSNSGPLSGPPSHEVWLHLGKGAACIHGALSSEPRSARRVAAEAGVNRKTCDRQLPVLAEHKLAVRQECGWVAGAATLAEVARAARWLGTDTKTWKRRRQVKAERVSYGITRGVITLAEAKLAHPDLAADLGGRFGGLEHPVEGIQDGPFRAVTALAG